MADGDERKLIIDDDWKSQAQAEKQKLADAEAAKAAEAGAPGAGPEGAIEPNFDELVKMLATQALMYLGAVPDPQTGKAMVAPEYAKLHIDLLGVLEEKTKGNLTEDEEKLLTSIGHELRLQFVEISKAVAQAVAEGKLSPQGGMMGAPGAPGGPAGASGGMPGGGMGMPPAGPGGM